MLRQRFCITHRIKKGIMVRSEIADIYCASISSGKIPALLEDFASETSTWTVVSGTVPSNSERRYLGISGLRRLAKFCQERLKIVAGEMTGCVVKDDCLFAFGKIILTSAVKKPSIETSFVVYLVWCDLQIVSAEVRIMWPFPSKDGDSEADR
jgi:hypothetical protein